ncbi:MAG: CocE/NonD family hydrolase [Myxococcota bacterium]
MQVTRSLPRSYRTVENTWIPMRDGTRLAARMWIPEGAEQEPVPAVLEYIPYRKRDGTRARDESMHGYFAGHGYASVRVDIRGSGDSEGVLEDEYLQSELDDGLDILRWLAAQPWCSGKVGIIGISWGGFNGLQIAALQPPELGAVISLCSTDDRYADDVHYMGGCLLGDNLSWSSVMFAFNSCPPDPAIVGDRWREMWLERLEGSGLWVDKWMRHPHRDDYWRHGSVCEDYGAIRVPVLLTSGFADGYSNAVFRMLEALEVPRRGLIGPWSHRYPHVGVPGPAIGYLQECVRWWDRWLKGIDNGVDGEPVLRVWMQDSVPAHPYYEERPGRWVAEPEWPSANVPTVAYTLARNELVDTGRSVHEEDLWVQSPLSCGLFAGKWCSYSSTPDLPHDQREEDGGALVFNSEPLTDRVEILGAPQVELDLAADKPVAQVAVRLSDVAPDGEATRVTYGLLNLTHRDGHEEPRPIEPGQRYRVTVKLNDVAQVFPAGHRLRLSISTSYWPLAWPPPEPTCLTIRSGTSRLVLPVRRPRREDADLRPFGAPEAAPCHEPVLVKAPRSHWKVHRDLGEDSSVLEVVKDEGVVRHEDIDLEVEDATTEWYRYRRKDWDSLSGETRAVRGFKRGDWHVRTVTRTILSSTATTFHVHATLDAYEGRRRVFSKVWNEEIPRKLV